MQVPAIKIKSSTPTILQLLGTDSNHYLATTCSIIGLSASSQAQCTISTATHWKITRLFSTVHVQVMKTGPGYNIQSTLAVVFVQYGVKRVPAI
jgi:hypothetical protein